MARQNVLVLFGLGLLLAIYEIKAQITDLCSSPEFDAITRTNDGNTYVFKGMYYWRVVHEGIAPGYPRLIGRDWPGLPSNIDAALTWRDGKTFFFKGDSYWRFKGRVPVRGYPKKISVGFAGIPDNIDAALLWSGNAATYFFKGDQYWKFDTQNSRKNVPIDYPKNISLWAGVPPNLNAAFQWENSKSYFFKGDKYYGFDDRNFKVQHLDDLPYPRETAIWWFGCKPQTTSKPTTKEELSTAVVTEHLVTLTEGPRLTTDKTDMVRDDPNLNTDVPSQPDETTYSITTSKSELVTITTDSRSLTNIDSTTITEVDKVSTEIQTDPTTELNETKVQTDPTTVLKETEVQTDPTTVQNETKIQTDPTTVLNENKVQTDPVTKQTDVQTDPITELKETEVQTDPATELKETQVHTDPITELQETEAKTDPTNELKHNQVQTDPTRKLIPTDAKELDISTPGLVSTTPMQKQKQEKLKFYAEKSRDYSTMTYDVRHSTINEDPEAEAHISRMEKNGCEILRRGNIIVILGLFAIFLSFMS